MPIYEYQGQQYDIATEDHAEAKAKILNYLGSQGQAPAQKTASKATQSDDFDFGSPMGTGAEEIMAAAKPAPSKPVAGKEPKAPPRAPYKNRLEMLDDAVNMLEEGANQADLKQSLQKAGVKWEDVVKHGQERGSDYFKQQAPLPPELFQQGKPNAAYAGTVKATPETEFTSAPYDWTKEAVGSVFKRADASLGDIATSYLMQTGVIDSDAAGRLIARNAKQRAANAPSRSIREGMEEIGNAETYGEAINALATNPRATFTMLVESLLVSAPNMVPGLVLGPAGVISRSIAGGSASGISEYGSTMADVLQDKKVNLLDPFAVSKALSDPKIMEEIKEKGAKRGLIVGVFDGATFGLAGRFLKPAMALIAEGKLAGTAAKKATMAAWGKELTMQMGGGAGGEFAAQKATGENKPADVLLEALAEGVTAPFEARSNLREANLAEQEAAINTELAAQKEPENTDLGELGAVRPSDDLKQAPPPPPPKTTPDAVRAERVQKEYERLVALGAPLDTAKVMAERRIAEAIKAENKSAAIKVPEGRVEEITQDLIAAGVPPQQAKIDAQILAQEEAQADELAQTETRGVANVAGPISEPSGKSAELAGQPSAEPPAGGAVGVDTSGMVPAGPDVTDTTAGERVEPTALEEKADEGWKDLGQVQRYEEPGVGTATTDKPHGIYTSPADTESPHKDLGGERSVWDVNPEANVLDVTPLAGPDVAMRESAVGAGAGVAAVKKLLGAERFEILRRMSKEELIAAISAQFPDVDFTKYYDAQEVMEALGAQLAKQAGYDAIWQADKDPAWSEFVALTDNAMTPVETKPAETKPAETEGTPSGTETPEAIEATQEGQEAPATGAVSKGKRGRPPVQQRHAVVETSEGKFEHVTDGDVVATYDNKKQATAAVNLAKAQDKGDTAKIAKFQAELDKALASQGRGRPAKPVSEEGTAELSHDEKVELNELEAALETYNSSVDDSAAKHAAMYISEVASDKNAPKAVRERAQQMLEDEIDPKDLPKGLRSSEGKVAKADTGFSKVVNGSQAIAHIIKTGNLFQRFVAQRIRNFVVGVKFVVVERGDPIPAQMRGARGLFVYTPGSKERTIYVRGASFGDMQGINVITVLHELLHAATASRIEAGLLKGFKNASLQKFMREMESLMKETERAYRSGVYRGTVSSEVQDLVEVDSENVEFDSRGNPKFEIFSNPHEFLAYGMSSPEFQKFLMNVQGKRGTGFSGFVDSIRDLFGVKTGDATAFTDLVDITDKMLGTRLTQVETKATALQQKIKYTPPEFDENADKGEQKELRTAKELAKARVKAEVTYQQSVDSQKVKNAGVLQKIRDPEKANILFKAAWKKMNRTQQSVAAKLPTWDNLAKMFKDELPHVQQAYELHNEMKGMAKALLEAAEERIRVTRNAFKADKTLEEKFTKLVYTSTDAQYDPSDTTQKIRNKKFDDEYRALGAKGQELYKSWRDYYVDVGDLFIELLDEQVRNISGLTDEVKSNLASVIRQTYETKDRIKPFFPFVRDEGDYWLAVGKPNSATRAFYIYESMADRDEDAQRIASEKKQTIEEMRDSGDMELGDDLDAMRNTARDSSKLLTSIFAAIDAIKLPAGDTEGTTNTYKENLKDSVYQVFLNTMPEQSFRMMFRHRKGRGGYRTDFIQNAARTATKMSTQLARLKYAQKMRNVTSAARDSIVGREHLLPVVQELERRVANVLSPRPRDTWDVIAGVANKATYLWTLTSASTALIQPISIYVSALPILAANHGFAPIKAAKELGKMMTYLNQYGVIKENPDGTHRYVAPSIANAKNLPEDEKRAIQAMTRKNVAQSTYVAQVYDYSETPVSELDSIRGRGKEAAYLLTGALMHNMERLTREAVYLASYRLGRQRGLSEADAIQQAASDTREALGDYETTNKPRWMQRGLGRVMFAMKMYPVVVIQQVAGNFIKMLPFLNKEGKKEALAKFIGIYMTAGSVAGLAGIPAFSILIHAIVAALKDKVDDDDLPEELKDMDPEIWFREVYMPQKFGEYSVGGVPLDEWIMDGPLNAVTGWSISSRIGLNDIWAKDGKSTKNVKEAAAAFVAAYFGGPTLSVTSSWLDAVEQYMLGDYEKGNEKLLPKPIKDILLAQKYNVEGIKSAAGVELVAPENVKTSEKVGQAIGFAPALTAGVKEAGFKLLSNEQDILNDRNRILRKLDIQNRKGTEEGDAKFSEIMDKDVEDFNRRYPDYALKIKDIKKSLKTKEEQRQKSPAGVTTTKKFYGVGDEAIVNLEKKLERREKEMEERRKVELTGMANK